MDNELQKGMLRYLNCRIRYYGIQKTAGYHTAEYGIVIDELEETAARLSEFKPVTPVNKELNNSRNGEHAMNLNELNTLLEEHFKTLNQAAKSAYKEKRYESLQPITEAILMVDENLSCVAKAQEERTASIAKQLLSKEGHKDE